jgi:adenylyltransferase/sulfurtransferase
VLGVLPGIIGTLQALETIKVITGVGDCSANKLLMFDGMSTSFRSLKLRPRQGKTCIVCGSKPEITRENLGTYDYEGKCGGPMHDKEGLALKVLPDSNRLSCQALKGKLDERKNNTNTSSGSGSGSGSSSFLLIDVRPRAEYDFASLSGSINLPMRDIEERLEGNYSGSDGQRVAYDRLLEGIDYRTTTTGKEINKKEEGESELPDLCVVCRRGNDSQLAVEKFIKAGISKAKAFDLVGGLQQWSKDIDNSFPIY